jgi:hypothetical protein
MNQFQDSPLYQAMRLSTDDAFHSFRCGQRARLLTRSCTALCLTIRGAAESDWAHAADQNTICPEDIDDGGFYPVPALEYSLLCILATILTEG